LSLYNYETYADCFVVVRLCDIKYLMFVFMSLIRKAKWI